MRVKEAKIRFGLNKAVKGLEEVSGGGLWRRSLEEVSGGVQRRSLEEVSRGGFKRRSLEEVIRKLPFLVRTFGYWPQTFGFDLERTN